MAGLECGICYLEYDIKSKPPKKLICGHTVCEICLRMEIAKTGVYTCGGCTVVDNRDIEDIKDDETIVKILKASKLFCEKHFNWCSDLNSLTLKPVCESCDAKCTKMDPNTININLTTSILMLYAKYKKTLSNEIKKLIKIYLNDTLQSKLEIYHMIIQYNTQDMNCCEHKEYTAVKMSENYFELYCQLNSENIPGVYFSFDSFKDNVEYYYQHTKTRVDPNFIFSSIPRYLSGENISYSRVLIELSYSMRKKLDKIEKIGCQNCGKLFFIGMQMPVTLVCGHFICYECSFGCDLCKICKASLEIKEYSPIQDLYKDRVCSMCPSKKLNFKDLPYHYICDCLYCSNCTFTVRNCIHCNSEKLYNVFPTVHKKTIKLFKYLELDLKCEGCNSNSDLFYIQDRVLVLCSNCSTNLNDKISLKNLYDLEKFLLQYTPYLQDDTEMADYIVHYPTLPLSLKIHFIKRKYCNKTLQADPKILRHFHIGLYEVVYPIDNNDPKKFRYSGSAEKLNLKFSTNKPIRLLGVVLGGRVDFGWVNVLVYFRLNNDNENTYQERLTFCSRNGYVIKYDIPMAKEFTVFAYYYSTENESENYEVNCELFSGKAIRKKMLKENGVTFSFSDSILSGPIMGIIYSLN